MAFDIKQLENFLVAARMLSFTKAADELFITQSALSKQISALEDSVGTELFQRRNNILSLTAAGELLYREGTDLLERMKNIEFLMQEAAAGAVGAINIAIQDTFLTVAPNLFDEFRERHPRVTFRVRFMLPQLLPAAIVSGEADVGTLHSFDLGRVDVGGLGIYKLIKDKYAVVVPATHPLAGRKTARLEEFYDDNVVNLEKLGRPAAIDAFIERSKARRAQGYPHPDPATFDDLMLQVSLGLGVTPLVSAIAHGNPRGNFVIDLEGDESEFDVLLIWKKSNRNPVLPLFLSLVREKFPGGE